MVVLVALPLRLGKHIAPRTGRTVPICRIEPTQAHEVGYVFIGKVGTGQVLVQAACGWRTERRKPCCGGDLAWSRVERHVGSARLTVHTVVTCLSGKLVR